MPIFSSQAWGEEPGLAAAPAVAAVPPCAWDGAAAIPVAVPPAAAEPDATAPAGALAPADAAALSSLACTNLPRRCRPGPGSAKICRVFVSTNSSMAACGEPSAAAVPHIVQKAAARGSLFICALLRMD